jgi:hypothetical protein
MLRRGPFFCLSTVPRITIRGLLTMGQYLAMKVMLLFPTIRERKLQWDDP